MATALGCSKSSFYWYFGSLRSFELAVIDKTIHALLHLGWVDAANGRKTASLAVYVKSRGWFSDFYTALIWPFRHLIVYPAWFARVRRRWDERVVPAH